jgi:hypothetical protein
VWNCSFRSVREDPNPMIERFTARIELAADIRRFFGHLRPYQ